MTARLRPIRDRLPGPRWLGALLSVLIPLSLLAGALWLMTTKMLANVHALDQKLRHWTFATMASMLVVGFASWAGLAIIGLQFAALLALLTGISEIVPTFGPLLAFTLAALVAATTGGAAVLGFVVVWVVVQGLESDVLLPLVMREAVRVPPLITLFTIVLWSHVLGVVGLLLALPLDLTLCTLFAHLRPPGGVG